MAAPKKYKEVPIGGLILEAGNSLNFKTGDWKTKRPIRQTEKCINCMICWANCPDMAIKGKDGNFSHFDYDYCKGCGICSNVCPVKCIKMMDESEFDGENNG